MQLLHLAFRFSVRVRYAPSPTGRMHIGALRTAYYNYLFAKKEGGKFIVRIEDTDQKRNIAGGTDHILDVLDWAGITPDESPRIGGPFAPYIQSERRSHYKAIQVALMKNNLAYPCFCESEQKLKGVETNTYLGTCRHLTVEQIKTKIANGEKYAIRLKNDLISVPDFFVDQLHGEVNWTSFDDFVIVKADGWPTFHFANVIDDWEMGITHVLRGQQWLSNTSKHIYLYKLLNAHVPKFIHLPLILSMTGKKLSKRDPTSSIDEIIQKDYDSNAVRNMLFRLGLSSKMLHQDPQELKRNRDRHNKKNQQKKEQAPLPQKPLKTEKIITTAEQISEFGFSSISISPAKFDPKLFDYLNKLAIRKKWNERSISTQAHNYFLTKIKQYLPAAISQQTIWRFLDCILERITVISELPQYSYYFTAPDYTTQASKADCKKVFGSQITLINNQFKFKDIPKNVEKNRKIIHTIRMIFEHLIDPASYSQLEIAKKISQYLYQSPETSNEEVYSAFRYMISGAKNGPNIVKACVIIGQQEIIKRIAAFSSL